MNLNFPRVVIIFSIIGSLVLGWFDNQTTARLSEAREAADSKVQKIVAEIKTKSHQLAQLREKVDNDKIGSGQESPEAYIRGLAQHNHVSLGEVDIEASTKPGQGIVDTIFTIKPSRRLKGRGFKLDQIGNFMYKLEAESQQVRVTHVKLTPLDKVDPHEYPSGSWVFEVQLTSRKRVQE